jgi:aminomethyltransferase
MLCAPDGGVLDDLVVYRQAEDRYLVVANASNTDVVLRELQERISGPGGRSGPAGRGSTVVADETAGTGLIAVQGPNGLSRLSPLTPLDLSGIRYYAGAYGPVADRPAWVARTGYTGEDGFEIFCAAQDAEHIWEALADGSPALPAAGLAARDTLRLEAGMPLYGNELGPDVTPYEAGLGRVVKLDKPGDFVGRDALAARAAAGPGRSLIGLVSRSRRVPRHGYAVLALSGDGDGTEVGTVTSGAPSPSLGAPIAMAYVSAGEQGPFGIDIRGNTEPATLTELPFYRRSK